MRHQTLYRRRLTGHWSRAISARPRSNSRLGSQSNKTWKTCRLCEPVPLKTHFIRLQVVCRRRGVPRIPQKPKLPGFTGGSFSEIALCKGMHLHCICSEQFPIWWAHSIVTVMLYVDMFWSASIYIDLYCISPTILLIPNIFPINPRIGLLEDRTRSRFPFFSVKNILRLWFRTLEHLLGKATRVWSSANIPSHLIYGIASCIVPEPYARLGPWS